MATAPPKRKLSRAVGTRGTYASRVNDADDNFSGDEYARTLYMQLAKVPVMGDGAQQLSRAEAVRRLKIANNAVKIVQKGTRN